MHDAIITTSAEGCNEEGERHENFSPSRAPHPAPESPSEPGIRLPESRISCGPSSTSRGGKGKNKEQEGGKKRREGPQPRGAHKPEAPIYPQPTTDVVGDGWSEKQGEAALDPVFALQLAIDLQRGVGNYCATFDENGQKWPHFDPEGQMPKTCDADTRAAIFKHVPSAETNAELLRYIRWALWGNFYDERTGLLVMGQPILFWIERGAVMVTDGDFVGYKVIARLRTHLPEMAVSDWVPEERCRLLICDGLPDALYRAVSKDRRTPAKDYTDRVYIATGKRYRAKQGKRERDRIERRLEGEADRAPSQTARRILTHMNGQSSRLLSDTVKRVPAAMDYLGGRTITSTAGPKMAERVRGTYFDALHRHEAQHKPYYRFSRSGRTDRIFGYELGCLNLPSDVREILFDGYYEIDLRSAHLFIASWMWEAEDVTARLAAEGYSVWADLAEHFGVDPQGDHFQAFKKWVKPALYSAVYYKPAGNVKADLSRVAPPFLAELPTTPGMHFGAHPLIEELLSARDSYAQKIERRGYAEHPLSGRKIHVGEEPGVDIASALSTVAQAYEQALMEPIIELEQERQAREERNYFRVALWLHDGAYVKMRRPPTRMKELDKRLARRCKRLGDVPAYYDCNQIQA